MRHGPAVKISLTAIVLASAGCHNGARWDMSGGWFRPKGEEWTIGCAEYRGVDRRRRAETLARELRQVKGIRPKLVSCRHADVRSQVLYGTYYRRIVPDTERLTVPQSLRDDLTLIQTTVTRSGGALIGARPISSPASDVGNAEWNLDNAKGTYTLLVALFRNTSDFYDRKAAAAAYAKELRSRGHEAYYQHGRVTSDVMAGTFGPDAIIEHQHANARQGMYSVSENSPEVKRLQAKEDFRFLLLNGHRQLVRGTGSGKKVYVASRLVPIRPDGGIVDEPETRY